MARLQVEFDIPKEIIKGIKKGDLKIFGGIVRDNAGRIVAHLKDAIPKNIEKTTKGKSFRNLIVIATGVVTAVGIGKFVKKHVFKKSKFRISFDNYFNSFFSQTLSMEYIRDLKREIGDLQNLVSLNKKEQLRLSNKIDSIHELTYRLLVQNNYNTEFMPAIYSDNKIKDLKNYLNIQEHLFSLENKNEIPC